MLESPLSKHLSNLDTISENEIKQTKSRLDELQELMPHDKISECVKKYISELKPLTFKEKIKLCGACIVLGLMNFDNVLNTFKQKRFLKSLLSKKQRFNEEVEVVKFHLIRKWVQALTDWSELGDKVKLNNELKPDVPKDPDKYQIWQELTNLNDECLFDLPIYEQDAVNILNEFSGQIAASVKPDKPFPIINRYKLHNINGDIYLVKSQKNE